MRFKGKKKLERAIGGAIVFLIITWLAISAMVAIFKALPIFELFLGGFVIGGTIYLFKHFKSSKNKSNLTVSTSHIVGDGTYSQETVGEYHYSKALKSIMASSDDPGRFKTRATLILENDNPHDHQAVAVFVDGLKVGHLPRNKVKSFRLKHAGNGHSFTCSALLLGGDDGRPNIGVWLDI